MFASMAAEWDPNRSGMKSLTARSMCCAAQHACRVVKNRSCWRDWLPCLLFPTCHGRNKARGGPRSAACRLHRLPFCAALAFCFLHEFFISGRSLWVRYCRFTTRKTARESLCLNVVLYTPTRVNAFLLGARNTHVVCQADCVGPPFR